MMTFRHLALLPGLLLYGWMPVLADETPPEDGLVEAMPSAAGAAAVDATTSNDGDATVLEQPSGVESASPLGFQLPPVLEDFVERLVEDGVRLPSAGMPLPASEVSGSVTPASISVDGAATTTDDHGDDGSARTEADVVRRSQAADGSDGSPEAVSASPAMMTQRTAAEVVAESLDDDSADPGEASPLAAPVSERPGHDEIPATMAQSPPDARSAIGGDADSWGPPLPDPAANEFGAVPIALLGSEIAPGNRERLHWTTGQSFSGSVMETPVVVVHGRRRGPRLCLTGGVHGDELNGIEVVRRVAYRVEPEMLAGTVIAVPIVNLLGFSRGSRYLPDRRDLNRFFPGSPYGSSASRIASSFFEAIIGYCDALVDVHTGSLDRANLPQVRGDLTNPAVLEFTRGFGATAVLHSPGSPGMLRYAASARGIPAATFEIGAPLRLQPEEIEHGVRAIETLLNKMGMIEQRRRWREPQAVFYESRWVRVDHGGMLFSEVALGDRVQRGQRLGRVIDPVSNRNADVIATDAGRIIGMALNQLVLPGFAAYNVGIAASEEQVVNEAAQEAAPDDERFLENDQIDDDQRLLEEADRLREDSLESARRRDGEGARH